MSLWTQAFAITPEEAASIVHAETNGKVLDAKYEMIDNQEVYLIKVITEDSRVIIVRVDVATGQILQ